MKVVYARVVASCMSPGKNSLRDMEGEGIKDKLTEVFARGDEVVIIPLSEWEAERQALHAYKYNPYCHALR